MQVAQRTGGLYLIYFLSGVAGLGYQMVWTRMFAVALGHEMPSVLAVVSAFFGGLALGAWVLDRRIARSPRPGGWYVGLELLIGVWGFVSLALIPMANDFALRAIGIEAPPGRHWLVAFLCPFVVLLPATVAMGATLPVMERCVAPRTRDGRCVGGLYAANTAGALFGTLSAAFLIIPAFGYRLTLVTLAVVNFVCAVSMIPFARQTALPSSTLHKAVVAPLSQRRLGVAVFFTGLLGIGYEVLGVRLMSQVAENTVYSFAAALIVYLAGTALGAGLYQRIGRSAPFKSLLTLLLCGIGASCLASATFFDTAIDGYLFLRDHFGARTIGIVARELALALSLFALPTTFMGATYAHLVQAAKRKEGGIGTAAALNTLGGALAPPILGVWLLPTVGSKWALVALAVAYLGFVPRLSLRLAPAVAIPVLLVLFSPARFYPVISRDGGRVIDHREGVMATITVGEDADGSRGLAVNNRFHMGDTGAAVYEKRQALIPLLLHGAPERALFLGVGTGITSGAALILPTLRVDAVELLPEVLDLLDAFAPENNSPHQHERAHLFAADARRFVRSSSDQYDVIVADLFHPARDGAGTLYTVEHFKAVRRRLDDGGLFCQWLPLHQLDEGSLRVIVRTFMEVFPGALAFLVSDSMEAPALGLIATLHPTARQREGSSATLDDDRIRGELAQVGLNSDVKLDGRFVAGSRELAAYVRGASVNTDDHPIVMFRVPFHVHTVRQSRHGRLKALLDGFTSDPARYVFDHVAPRNATYARRLTEYVAARNAYLRGRIAEVEGRKSEAIAAYVQSTRVSSYFDPGYDRCVQIARETAPANRETARHLLKILVDVRPESVGARAALDELSVASD